MLLLVPARNFVAAVKSPKSDALPVEAIVIYWITFSLFLPPPKTPLVFEDSAAISSPIWAVKLPKSAALPVEAIVI